MRPQSIGWRADRETVAAQGSTRLPRVQSRLVDNAGSSRSSLIIVEIDESYFYRIVNGLWEFGAVEIEGERAGAVCYTL